MFISHHIFGAVCNTPLIQNLWMVVLKIGNGEILWSALKKATCVFMYQLENKTWVKLYITNI